MKAMVIKEFRELLRDRRTLALLLFIPTMLLIVFGFAANFTVERNEILIAGPGAHHIANKLQDIEASREGFTIERIDPTLTEADIASLLRADAYDAILLSSSTSNADDPLLSSSAHMWIDGSALFDAMAVEKTWMQTIAEDVREHARNVKANIDALQDDIDQRRAEISTARSTLTELRSRMEDLRATLANPLPAAPGGIPIIPAPSDISTPPETPALPDALTLPEVPTLPELPTLPDTSLLDFDSIGDDASTTTLFNPDLKTSWVMLPGLVGLIVQFISVVIMSIGLVREREAGTLEQLAVMPLHPGAIIAGKIAPYFVISLCNIAVITALASWIFGVPFVGSYSLYALLTTLFLFAVLGVGILISAVSQNTGQAIQLSVMTLMPQVLLSGLIFPLDSMAAGVRWLGYAMPLTWFTQAAQGIVLRGATLADVSLPLGILAAMAVFLFVVANVRMTLLLQRGGEGA